MSNTSPTVKPNFAPSPTSPNSTTSSISPGNLSLKGIDVTNTRYTTSHLRTLPLALPFPHPKWHTRPSRPNNRDVEVEVEVYETISPLLEDYDPVSGYMGSVGAVMESVETDYDFDAGDSGLGVLGGVDGNTGDERQDGTLGSVGGFREWRSEEWMGYVRFRESAVRSSIKRERDADGERADEGAVGRRKSKRVRERR